MSTLDSIYSNQPEGIYDSPTHADGPKGKLPLTDKILRESPSGDMFGMTLNAGMGWEPSELANDLDAGWNSLRGRHAQGARPAHGRLRAGRSA